MPGATLTTVSAILKDLYLPPVQEQLNNEVLFAQRWDVSGNIQVPGNQAVFPVHKTRSGGVYARPEDTDIGAAGNQGYARAVYDVKYLYGRFRVTGPSTIKTQGSAQAFLQVLRGEIDGLKNDLKRDLARQLWGDGSAQIAQCGTTTASTTVVLNATSGAEAIRHGHLHIGMIIDIGTTADYDVITANRTITDVNVSTPSITIADGGAAVTTSGSHFVIRSGNAASSSAIYEISGVQQLVSTAANTFGGIDASAAGNGYWDNLRQNVANVLSQNDLVTNINTVEGVAGGNVTALVSSFGLQRQLFNILQSQVRYVDGDVQMLKGGYKALEFSGKPFIADRDCPYGRVYLFDEAYTKIIADGDWKFLDDDGLTIRQVSNRDAWEGFLVRYMNIATNRRNTQFVMFGITNDTTGV
jgi:hypothetical protein